MVLPCACGTEANASTIAAAAMCASRFSPIQLRGSGTGAPTSQLTAWAEEAGLLEAVEAGAHGGAGGGGVEADGGDHADGDDVELERHASSSSGTEEPAARM